MFYAGLALFFGIHLIPSSAKARFHIVRRTSVGIYLGLYSLLSLVGLVLIIVGYENSNNALFASNEFIYEQTKYLMLIAFVFLASAYTPTHIRKYSKHPMLIGVVIWAGTHLLNNPDTHSVFLFGSFLLYSLAAIANSEIQRKIIKPVSPSIFFDILAVAIGVVLTLLIFNYHHVLSGVSLLG